MIRVATMRRCDAFSGLKLLEDISNDKSILFEQPAARAMETPSRPRTPSNSSKIASEEEVEFDIEEEETKDPAVFNKQSHLSYQGLTLSTASMVRIEKPDIIYSMVDREFLKQTEKV